MSNSTQRNDGLDRSLGETGDLEDAESLPQRELRKLVGGSCADCGKPYSAREVVFSIFLGLKNAPRCLTCTSRRLERVAGELWSDMLAYFHRRECYLKAWQEAERIDGVAGCGPEAAPPPVEQASTVVSGDGVGLAAEWDAGDMGCGELVMALRGRMGNLRPAEVIRVTATDPAAPEDLPAWCRLCGHTLVAMEHPHYWIRRKGD